MKRHTEDNTKYDEHDTVNKINATWEYLSPSNKEDAIKGKWFSVCFARKRKEK